MKRTFEECPKCGKKPMLSINTIAGEGYAACKCCKGDLVKSTEPNQSDRYFDIKKKALSAWNKKVREGL